MSRQWPLTGSVHPCVAVIDFTAQSPGTRRGVCERCRQAVWIDEERFTEHQAAIWPTRLTVQCTRCCGELARDGRIR